MSPGSDDEPSPPDGEFFASVVEGSADPIVSVDGAGSIVYVNPAAEDALGREAASLTGRRLGGLIPDATAGRRAASLRDRLGDPARLVDAGDVSVPLAAADGETRAFSARFHAHEVGGETVYSGVFRERNPSARDRELRTFRNLVEHAGHAIYVTDTDGTIEYVNPAFVRHTGYEPAEVIGETPAVLSSGEMSDGYFASLWETLRAGEVWEEEIVDRRKDGSRYHAHQTIAPVFDDAGSVSRFVAIQTDVTERKAAEWKLKQYRDIVERLDDPILLQDRDGGFELLNEAVSEFAGVPRDALYGEDESAFMDAEAAAEIDERRREVLRTGEPVEYEVSPSFERSGREATFSTRRYPYYDGDGTLAGTFAICRDVTEIKEREADLERFERAVDGATDLIAAVDRDERFLFANEQYRTYHGIDDADVTGLTLSDVVDGDRYPDVRRQVSRALAGRAVEYRATRTHPGRGTRTFDVRYYPLDDPDGGDGDAVGVVGVLRDVTDSENRARQLRVVDRVLQHNLRNAMTVIRGRARQIADDAQARETDADDERAAGAAGPIATAAADVVARAEALLSTSEKVHQITEVLSDPPETEPVDVAEAVETLAAGIGDEFPAASVTASTPDGPVRASATAWIDRAIDELVRNAIVHHDRGSPTVEVAVAATEDAVAVTVTDDGPGLTGMNRDVLETGEAIDALYHGSGLGLWLVYWVVQQSGGEATVRDAAPRGTVVTVTLPRSDR
ncbi:PAS domain-containing sensor histidine kinase [Halorubrum lipolyticum]|uniref:PAS/PAC sensor signal transduction histidine kinase n=1 Tax=Halorubrum lipolyticum DSM 21995 TaxID=1227482 RepID=M0NPP5_9EURY|nr:PAS domain S-box protein [Halorubrum lipolyticum]EMA59154.1 PAS/PAC sensor signal transduction histidine kinase [Halorubrum lipolyticum DSM 21995]